MTNEYSMGIIEVVYNPNGHTYWVEGIIGDEAIEFHHTTSMGERVKFETILLEKVREINPEYYIVLRDLSYGSKNKYLYEVMW